MKSRLFIIVFFVLLSCSAENDMIGNYKMIYKLKASADKKFNEEKFNLKDKNVSDFMIQVVNKFETIDNSIAGSYVLYYLLKIDPEKGLCWILDNQDKFTKVGRINIYDSISSLSFQEVLKLKIILIDDKTEIDAPRGEVPPMSKNVRICDESYSSLFQIVWGPIYSKDMKKWDEYKKENSFDLPIGLFITDSIEKRDKNIDKLKKWWKEHSLEALKDKPKLSEQFPELSKRFEEFSKKIELEIKNR